MEVKRIIVQKRFVDLEQWSEFTMEISYYTILLMCIYKETIIYICSYQTRSQTRQASTAAKTLLWALLKQGVRLWWKWRDVSIKSSRWNDGSRNETGKCQWKRVITYWHDFENEGNCINNKDLRLDNTSFLTKREQTNLVNVFISDS